MSFITHRRHWDVVEYEATHRLRYAVWLKEFGTNRTALFEQHERVHLRASRKEGEKIVCLVYSPRGKRVRKLKNGFSVWFVDFDQLERLKQGE